MMMKVFEWRWRGLGLGALAGFYASIGVALVWMVFLLWFYATARVDVYLAEEFVLYPLVTGLVLFVWVGHALWMGPQALGSGHEGAFEELLAPRRPRLLSLAGGVILLVPLGIVWKMNPQRFSFEAMQKRGLESGGAQLAWQGEAVDLDVQFPKNAQGDRPVSNLHLVGASGDEVMRGSFEGEPVVVVGQMAPWPESRGGGEGRLLMYQLMVSCCASDAQPVTTELHMGELGWDGELRGEWAQVRGTVGFVEDEVTGYWRPLLEVKEIVEAQEPKEMFLQR